MEWLATMVDGSFVGREATWDHIVVTKAAVESDVQPLDVWDKRATE